MKNNCPAGQITATQFNSAEDNARIDIEKK